MFIKRQFLILLVIFSIALGFGGGFEFNRIQNSTSLPVIQNLINLDGGKPEDVDFALFWKAWDSVSGQYVDQSKIDKQKMLYGAISGMVNSIGDPYTVFFEPELSKKFEEEISGSFGGVGIEVGKRDGILTVIAPIEGTPAYEAGIKAGERILAVGGTSTLDISVEEAVNLIRGKRGTSVILTISNPDQTKNRDVELTRETIKVPTVKYETFENGQIGYIEIATFNKNVDPDFKDAVDKFVKSNARSLIIDLRNNPGGLLDSAINIAGFFLDKGQIVVKEEFRDKTNNSFTADGNGILKSYPIIVLINGGSASASEILAGALHDNLGTKLVGETTFGKGSVQELVDLGSGSSLKITIAKWLTPNGISINEAGIEPDIEVIIDPETPESENLEFGIPTKDPQLDKAIELLR